MFQVWKTNFVDYAISAKVFTVKKHIEQFFDYSIDIAISHYYHKAGISANWLKLNLD